MSDKLSIKIKRELIDQVFGDGFSSGASEQAIEGMYRVAMRDSNRQDTTSRQSQLEGIVRELVSAIEAPMKTAPFLPRPNGIMVTMSVEQVQAQKAALTRARKIVDG